MIRALVPLGVMPPFPPLPLTPVVVDRADPVPSLAIALWRAVPAPYLGNTVEMVLMAEVRLSRPPGCESRRASPAPYRWQHLGELASGGMEMGELALE